MKKIFAAFLVLAMAVSLSACGAGMSSSQAQSANAATSSRSSADYSSYVSPSYSSYTYSDSNVSSDNSYDSTVTSTSSSEYLSSSSKSSSCDTITEKQAYNLIAKTLGTSDKETGNEYSFGYICTIKQKGVKYYVFQWRWLVDNNHTSRIGELFVTVDGSAVFAGEYKGSTCKIYTDDNYLK